MLASVVLVSKSPSSLFLEKLSKMVPVGRIGEPDEVAQAAEFIFMNDYYSGRCVDLDGAQRM